MNRCDCGADLTNQIAFPCCPKCGQLNENNAKRCSCGFIFPYTAVHFHLPVYKTSEPKRAPHHGFSVYGTRSRIVICALAFTVIAVGIAYVVFRSPGREISTSVPQAIDSKDVEATPIPTLSASSAAFSIASDALGSVKRYLGGSSNLETLDLELQIRLQSFEEFCDISEGGDAKLYAHVCSLHSALCIRPSINSPSEFVKQKSAESAAKIDAEFSPEAYGGSHYTFLHTHGANNPHYEENRNARWAESDPNNRTKAIKRAASELYSLLGIPHR